MCVEFNPPVLVLFKVLCVFTSALVQYIVYYFACALNTYARVSEHEYCDHGTSGFATLVFICI